MRWFIYNWPKFAAITFVALAFIMGLWGRDRLDTITLILIYNFMALLAHQCEEYVLPGGVQIVLNVMYGGKKEYDRYPGNTANGALINVLGIAFFLAATIFPQAIWLGLATMLFGFIELLVHGLPMNITSRSWYNPGLATSIFLFLPIGIYYITYVTSMGLLSGADWLRSALTVVVAGAVIVGFPLFGLKNRNTKYPITQEQLNKFHMVEKFKARGIIRVPTQFPTNRCHQAKPYQHI